MTIYYKDLKYGDKLLVSQYLRTEEYVISIRKIIHNIVTFDGYVDDSYSHLIVNEDDNEHFFPVQFFVKVIRDGMVYNLYY